MTSNIYSDNVACIQFMKCTHPHHWYIQTLTVVRTKEHVFRTGKNTAKTTNKRIKIRDGG